MNHGWLQPRILLLIITQTRSSVQRQYEDDNNISVRIYVGVIFASSPTFYKLRGWWLSSVFWPPSNSRVVGGQAWKKKKTSPYEDSCTYVIFYSNISYIFFLKQMGIFDIRSLFRTNYQCKCFITHSKNCFAFSWNFKVTSHIIGVYPFCIYRIILLEIKLIGQCDFVERLRCTS